MAAVFGGCTTYERRPLDADATRQAFLLRSANDESVRAFAETLAKGEGRTAPYDAADGLRIDEAEAFALVFNPTLRVARLEAGVGRAGAEHAGLWDDPTLGADVERILSDTGGASRWVRGINVGLTIPISGRLSAEKARAKAEAAAELDRLAAQEWEMRIHLRERWLEWSTARVKAIVTADAVARVRIINDIAQKQEQAGSMSRLEARLMQSELAKREMELVMAQSHERESEAEIRETMGLHASAPVSLLPTLVFVPTWDDPANLLEIVGSSNLELTASRSAYEVAERSLQTEVRKQYPDLTLSPGVGSDQGDDRVSLGVSIALPIWNRNQQGVAEATAKREAARARFEAAYEGLAARLAMSLERLDTARNVRAIVESTMLPLAEAQEADARRVAELGRLEPLMLLASLQSLHEAKLRQIESRASEAAAIVQIEALVGPGRSPMPSIEAQSTTQPNRSVKP